MKSENTTTVTVLGHTFQSEEERRAFFREELRKKLPELKKMEGFPIGEDEDIIALSDPPYYTACPNPWLNDFIAEWEKEKQKLELEGKRKADFKVDEPYASDVSEGKNNPIYRAHSYHTKVPHPAIMRYILHYTQPGDIVFDGFAGTGMTGVAASTCENPNDKQKVKFEREGKSINWGKRNAICLDLSPIASYISYSLNNISHDSTDFKKKLHQLKKKYTWMFETKHTNGKLGNIVYTVWNEIVVCDSCGEESEFMDLFVKVGEGKILSEAICDKCGIKIKRRKVNRKTVTSVNPVSNEIENSLDVTPYMICYTYNNKRYFKKSDEYDLKIIDRVNSTPLNSFVPLDKLPAGDKTSDPINKHINYVTGLYTYRTLLVLSDLWSEATLEEKFYLTNSISRNLTKFNRFVVNKHNPKGRINGPLSGTLYVPSEVVEQNPFDIISYKLYDSENSSGKQAIACGSSTDLSLVPSSSIDYLFVDPPFGANIMYSELNFISESWLQVKTNSVEEAIENKSQNKDKLKYQELMTKAFKEFFRILKPGKWMTIEFSNTSAAIWNCIQTAIVNSGFIIAGNVSTLNKVHGGIKAMRYDVSVNQDLIISCYKPSLSFSMRFEKKQHEKVAVWNFVKEHLNHLPIHLVVDKVTTAIVERSPKILYDRLIAFYVQRNLAVPIGASEFQKGLKERFVERDGMFFTDAQVQVYDQKKSKTSGFKQLSLLVSSEKDGILWLRGLLKNGRLAYRDINPKWMQALSGLKKGDILPELIEILEENFLKDKDGRWYIPDTESEADLEALRTKRLLKTFNTYKKELDKSKRKKLKQVRAEALRAGFKQCYQDKDFKTIIRVGDRIPQKLLLEDEILLQFYDIASSKVD